MCPKVPESFFFFYFCFTCFSELYSSTALAGSVFASCQTRSFFSCFPSVHNPITFKLRPRDPSELRPPYKIKTCCSGLFFHRPLWQYTWLTEHQEHRHIQTAGLALTISLPSPCQLEADLADWLWQWGKEMDRIRININPVNCLAHFTESCLHPLCIACISSPTFEYFA